MRRLYFVLLLLGSISLLYHCQPDRNFIQDGDAKLEFSLDTVYFDTVFTTVGSITKSFRVYNPYDRFINIKDIDLVGGSNSVFRMNVDGVPGYEFENYELAPKDSMFIFVEAKLNPNESPDILRIQDSIIFSVNGNIQDIDLVAWGQDVHMIKDSILDSSTTWIADKPYLIIGYVAIDSLQTLTIEEGVKIYMHRDAIIYVLGSLKIMGSLENPVQIQGDRLDEFYKDQPGQWRFIFYQNGSENNVIEHANIINGTMGLWLNSPMYSEIPVLSISNTEIKQMSYAGIRGQGSSIDAYNTVIGDCGYSCVELLYEGSYNFNHCTFANYWPSGYSIRKTPAISIYNYLSYIDTADNIITIYSDITKANFTNCIIDGSRSNEILIGYPEEGVLNYLFDHCLTQLDKTVYDYTLDPYFMGIINDKDPRFDSLRVSYELDSLSPAIDQGKLEYAVSRPYDKNNLSRLGDSKPDLGAFERIKE